MRIYAYLAIDTSLYIQLFCHTHVGYASNLCSFALFDHLQKVWNDMALLGNARHYFFLLDEWWYILCHPFAPIPLIKEAVYTIPAIGWLKTSFALRKYNLNQRIKVGMRDGKAAYNLSTPHYSDLTKMKGRTIIYTVTKSGIPTMGNKQ